MLSRVLPWTAAPGLPADADPQRDPLTIALRTALVLSVAWLVTSMYTLSWYDLIAWMPLAVLAASKLDRIMLLRIAPLSLAYVPGRALDVGPALDFTATRIRDTVSPIVQFGVLVAIVLWWTTSRTGRAVPAPSKRPARTPAGGQGAIGQGRRPSDARRARGSGRDQRRVQVLHRELLPLADRPARTGPARRPRSAPG